MLSLKTVLDTQHLNSAWVSQTSSSPVCSTCCCVCSTALSQLHMNYWKISNSRNMRGHQPFRDGQTSESGRATLLFSAIGISLVCALSQGHTFGLSRSPGPNTSGKKILDQPVEVFERRLRVTDLSTEVAYDVNPSSKVNVYVYDEPQLNFKEIIGCYTEQNGGVPPWQDEAKERGQNTAEIWLHRALLIHPWRVHDPEQADVFYVPLYAMTSQMHDWGRGFRISDRNDPTITHNTCGGSTHAERMDAAVDFLRYESIYFNRYGGADHLLVCSWWATRFALSSLHRMILRRVILGTPERVLRWTRPGCGEGRLVVVPYTPSKFLTSTEMLGGLSLENRDILFFFAGSGRGRPERQNLDVSGRGSCARNLAGTSCPA